MKNTPFVPFVEPVFKGDRFANHRLPIQALPDLLAYEAIIRALAKELYLISHKGKTRLPKGFQERFKLGIADIQSGSVVTTLSREYDTEDKTEDEFEQARDFFNEFILSVHAHSPLDKFPKNVIGLFDNLGKTLQDDESIEWRIPGKTVSSTYSKHIRSEVLSIHKKAYQDICYLSGSVSGFDAEKKKLFVVLEDGQSIEGPLDSSFDDRLRDIAPQYKKKEIAVTLVGIAKYQPDGSVSEIKKLQHLIIYQEGVSEFFPDLKKQFDHIRNLEDGWLDGSGTSFSSPAVDEVCEWLKLLLKPGDIPAPFIYPANHHIIECEWSFGFWEVSFSFLLQNRNIVLHAAHTQSEAVQENRMDIKEYESIEKSRRFLTNLLQKISI